MFPDSTASGRQINKGVQMNKKGIAVVFFLGSMLILGARQFTSARREKERKAAIAQALDDLEVATEICKHYGNAQVWTDCANQVGDSRADGRK